MNQQDVKLGMKVVPHNKTPRYGYLAVEEDNWEKASVVWRMAKQSGQPFLYVNSWHEGEQVWLLNNYKADRQVGDFFYASDFEPYVEESNG